MRYCAINALSLSRSVGRSRATSGHSVNVTLGLGHVVISSSADDTLRCVPDENGTLCAGSDNILLVGRDRNFCDLARVADTLEVINAIVVVPQLDYLIVARGDEVLTLCVDCECVELTSLRAVEHANCLAIIAVPVANLTVGACSQDL